MAPVGFFPLLLILTLFSPATKDIEKAFFQNDAKGLSALFSSSHHLNISFPEPISFSDQISSEQAFFLFRQIYASYATFEFYADNEPPLFVKERSIIFKARWSFKNKNNNNQYVLQVFFYLVQENDLPPAVWRITEIKAEKL